MQWNIGYVFDIVIGTADLTGGLKWDIGPDNGSWAPKGQTNLK
jgi:hypothetical protein